MAALSPESRALILRALENNRGDDHHRAERQFAAYLPFEMHEEHGDSGKTRQQVLAEAWAHSNATDKAIREVKALP